MERNNINHQKKETATPCVFKDYTILTISQDLHSVRYFLKKLGAIICNKW